MSTRIADPRRLHWFHFFPLIAAAEVVLWLAVVNVYPSVPGFRHWYQPVIWLLLAAVVLSAVCAFVCRNRAGLGTPIATWLCVIWGKDAAIWRSSNAENTGLSSADKLVLLVATVAFAYWGWRWGTWDERYAAAAELALAALFVFAFFPGVHSIALENWDLRPVTSDGSRLEGLLQTLKRRIGSVDSNVGRSKGGTPHVTFEELENGTPDAVLQAVRESAARASHSGDRIPCEYSVSLLRTPIAVDASPEPQVIGIEKVTLAIDRKRLNELRDKNRSQPLEFRRSLEDHIVHSRSDDIFQFCVVLEALFRKYQLSPWDRLQTVLGFCQQPNIRYVLDESDESTRDLDGSRIGDYCRYPLETLVDKQGDCDCHSILAACLCYTLGYDCCVFSIRTKNAKSLHLALGIMPPAANILLPDSIVARIGKRHYYYCETTGAWQIGRMPADLDPQTIEIWWPRKDERG